MSSSFLFLTDQYAISADVEGIFLLVGFIPMEQQCLHLLCLENPITNLADFNALEKSWKTYAPQITASGNLVLHREAAEGIQNFFMDDCSKSSVAIEIADKKIRNLSVC